MDPLSAKEKRGLWNSLWATLIFAIVLLLLVYPEGAVLRNQETGAVAGSPFLRGIVAIIFVYFLMVGVVYGRTVGTINNDRDVINAMALYLAAGAAGVGVLLWVLEWVLGLNPLSGARGVDGFLLQVLAGLAGGYVFARYSAANSPIRKAPDGVVDHP